MMERTSMNYINHIIHGTHNSDFVPSIAQLRHSSSQDIFKTSTKPKKENWIENYFVQETAYAVMYYERCGVKVDSIVTIISTEEGSMQIIQKTDLDYYYQLLVEYINEFMQDKLQ